MSRCNSCATGRGCHDFSSRAEQLPSLVAIDVVEKLLLQALKNTANRACQAAAGDMSDDELKAANKKLVDWLAQTFSGANPHFQSSEDWNPRGLAHYLRDVLAENFKTLEDEKLKDDEEVIHTAAGIFLADVYGTLHALAIDGHPFAGIENTEPCVRLVNFWAQVMVGAPMFEG